MSASYLTSRQLRRRLPLVDRFMTREARVQQLVNNQERPINPQPFQPHKDQVTGRWAPSRLSLRRQAQLGKQAYRDGRFNELIRFVNQSGSTQSVKLEKMKARIEEIASEAMEGSEGALSSMRTDKILAKMSREESEKKAKALAKALAATRGPYCGRSLRNLFKGTKAERDAPGRKRETAEKLSTMERTVEIWRKTRAEAKNKTRPSLPF